MELLTSKHVEMQRSFTTVFKIECVTASENHTYLYAARILVVERGYSVEKNSVDVPWKYCLYLLLCIQCRFCLDWV